MSDKTIDLHLTGSTGPADPPVPTAEATLKAITEGVYDAISEAARDAVSEITSTDHLPWASQVLNAIFDGTKAALKPETPSEPTPPPIVAVVDSQPVRITHKLGTRTWSGVAIVNRWAIDSHGDAYPMVATTWGPQTIYDHTDWEPCAPDWNVVAP